MNAADWLSVLQAIPALVDGAEKAFASIPQSQAEKQQLVVSGMAPIITAIAPEANVQQKIAEATAWINALSGVFASIQAAKTAANTQQPQP